MDPLTSTFIHKVDQFITRYKDLWVNATDVLVSLYSLIHASEAHALSTSLDPDLPCRPWYADIICLVTLLLGTEGQGLSGTVIPTLFKS